MAGGERYEFGDFTLDVSERRLCRRGQPVALEPKAHDVLAALLRRAGRLVSKRDLLNLVWPDSFVEEGILAVHVSSLRKALGYGGGDKCYIETVPRSGYRFIEPVKQESVDSLAAKGWSVAVLPAQPFTSEILSERDQPTGLTLADALIERLGRFKQIVVRPASAVRAYSRAGANLAAAGQTLHTDAVLASDFVRIADRVRVSARLIRSEDGAELWKSEFDEPASDLLAVADAIAASVAAYLGLTRGSPGRRPRPRLSLNPEVYEHFGRGRFALLRASMLEVPKAIEAFRAAIELAPDYAAAHAGLALAQCAQAELRLRPPAEAYSEAKSSALQALAMDPECADAQVALAAVLFWSEWNWPAAEKSLERALEINPNHSEAYLLFGRLLEARGRFDEALAMKRRALERDPFSPLVHLQVSLSFFLAHRYDESIEWASKTLELDPRHPHAREFLAGCYWKKGDFDRYMAENLKHAELHGVPPEALEPLKQAYAAEGCAGVRRLQFERAALQPQAFPAMQLAVLYGEAGDLDSAFHHLSRALEQRDPGLVHLAVGPQWDAMREDARFDECLGKMGLWAPR